MEQIFIGIDGGGTKTAILAARKDGIAVKSGQTTGASWREHGAPQVARSIRQAVDTLTSGPICGMAAGLPCYGESVDGDAELEQAMKAEFPGIPLLLCNDVEVGWAGAFDMQPGVHLVAGTGSIAYGRDSKSVSARSGGWDEFFSDEGSGYWLARKAMELFSKQSDGRAAAGPLLKLFREELRLARDVDLIDYLHKNLLQSRKNIAGMQILLEKAALSGDNAACGLYQDAARELCLMAEAVRNRLSLPDRGWLVSYSGGVFKAGNLILEPLSNDLKKIGATLQPPLHTPVEGALMMAIAHFA